MERTRGSTRAETVVVTGASFKLEIDATAAQAAVPPPIRRDEPFADPGQKPQVAFPSRPRGWTLVRPIYCTYNACIPRICSEGPTTNRRVGVTNSLPYT